MEETFYATNRGESGWRDGVLFTGDKYEILIEEIKTILDTKSGTILGAEDMDGDLEKFIFMKYVDPRDVDKKITEQIYRFSILAQEFNINVKSDFAEGSNNKICLSQITINHIDTPELKENVKIVFS
jgi:hypothetical protein